MLVFAQYEAEKTRLLDEETKKRFGISQVYRELDLQSSGAFFGVLGRMMNSHNRTAFEIGKLGSISKIAVDTITAARGAYAALSSIPIIGPGLGAAAYAAIMISGFADAQRVKSTQFGGTPGGGGGGGGAPAPVFNANPITGVPTGSSQTVINVSVITQGNVIGTDGMQQLVDDIVIPAFRDAIDNRSVVIIGPNSRQAQDLVPA
jgi:hypothetical protein